MRKDITVIIPTSVIRSHPSTAIIDETINNIRYHLPDSEIILQIDGIRDEQLHRKKEYDEYKKIQAREKIIKRMENIKARIYNKPSNSINPKLKINIPKIPQSIITITFLIFLLGLLILLAYIASHQ